MDPMVGLLGGYGIGWMVASGGSSQWLKCQ